MKEQSTPYFVERNTHSFAQQTGQSTKHQFVRTGKEPPHLEGDKDRVPSSVQLFQAERHEAQAIHHPMQKGPAENKSLNGEQLITPLITLPGISGRREQKTEGIQPLFPKQTSQRALNQHAEYISQVKTVLIPSHRKPTDHFSTPKRSLLFRGLAWWKVFILLILLLLVIGGLEILLADQTTYQIVTLIIGAVLLSNLIGHQAIISSTVRGVDALVHTLSTRAVRTANQTKSSSHTAESSRDVMMRALSSNTSAYLQALRVKWVQDKENMRGER